jgi:hypothetical protein
VLTTGSGKRPWPVEAFSLLSYVGGLPAENFGEP